jgi:uncharacterized membrane protein
VVLVEYPRKGVWALAFTTGAARGPTASAAGAPELVNLFIPTTPNPTSGFYLLVPEKELTPIDITVEEAFKLVMSAGMVAPDDHAVHARADRAASSDPPGGKRPSVRGSP